MRPICLAYMEIGGEYSVENAIPNSGYTCKGIVGIKDPVRPGVREFVAICKAAGMNVRMVTGDNIHTVKEIAGACDILTNGIAIEGPAFRENKKNDWELHDLIPKIQIVAQSFPIDRHNLRNCGDAI
ncbi:hypothetical protein K1719_019747 [Acacia pycnantha]|nr:hypothetical protein K1719_019747 [Acacia pycnantha]